MFCPKVFWNAIYNQITCDFVITNFDFAKQDSFYQNGKLLRQHSLALFP